MSLATVVTYKTFFAYSAFVPNYYYLPKSY